MSVQYTTADLVSRARALARGPRRILGIVGAPGAGKSTLAELLVAELDGAAVCVPMDGFHLEDSLLRRLGRRERKGAIDTFDDAGYASLMQRLAAQPGAGAPQSGSLSGPPGAGTPQSGSLSTPQGPVPPPRTVSPVAEPGMDGHARDGAGMDGVGMDEQGMARHGMDDGGSCGETVYAPWFDRDVENALGSAVPIAPQVPLVITEGNYLLAGCGAWPRARAVMNEVWFLDAPEQIRHERLVARHRSFGKSEQEAIGWTYGTDERNAELIASTAADADLVVRWA